MSVTDTNVLKRNLQKLYSKVFAAKFFRLKREVCMSWRTAVHGCLLWQQMHIRLCLQHGIACQLARSASLNGGMNALVVVSFVYLGSKAVWKGQKCHL